MKEQFDKRLVEKIKGSFENYEEPFDPQQWDKFSDAYFKKKKPNHAWLWPLIISGVAASLVIGFLIWPVALEKVNEESLAMDDVPSTEIGATAKEEEKVMESILPALTDLNDQLAEDAHPMPKQGKSPFDIAQSRENEDLPIEVPDARQVLMTLANEKSDDKLDNLKFMEKHEAKAGEFQPEVKLGEHDVVIPTLALEAKSELIEEEHAQKIINSWAFAGAPVIPKEIKEGHSGVRLGLVMAPQATSNPAAGLNLGAGVMSEITLTKKLKLDVGVTYARQSLVPTANNNLITMGNDARQLSGSGLYFNPGPLQNVGFSRQSAMLTSNIVNPFMPTYQLNFTNLDIPINLKYQVMERPQSGLYIISGVSSMIYLNQSTTETFTNPYMGFGPSGGIFPNQMDVLTTEIAPEGGESSVDLGRMLNLSFGYEYRLTNGTFLSFEPFYKFPLGSMTFIDQQFSIGGVNLRMNFQFKK